MLEEHLPSIGRGLGYCSIVFSILRGYKLLFVPGKCNKYTVDSPTGTEGEGEKGEGEREEVSPSTRTLP